MKNWSTSRAGKLKGAKAEFHRFRSKHKASPSVRFTTGAIRTSGATTTLPVLGRIKLHEDAGARLTDLQGRLADRRRDPIHKLTTDVARTHGTVVVEDPFVAGMVKNRRLARSVADAPFGEIRRQLACTTGWHGGNLIVADHWFASSKTCSDCGAVRAKLTLSERTYRCDVCGMTMDRDGDAARNLAKYCRNELRIAASGAEIEDGRGADRMTWPARQVAVRRQPGTATTDQTGTVPQQRRTTSEAAHS